MSVHRANTKMSAMRAAVRARKRGFNATIFKTSKGWRVSVTRG